MSDTLRISAIFVCSCWEWPESATLWASSNLRGKDYWTVKSW